MYVCHLRSTIESCYLINTCEFTYTHAPYNLPLATCIYTVGPQCRAWYVECHHMTHEYLMMIVQYCVFDVRCYYGDAMNMSVSFEVNYE